MISKAVSEAYVFLKTRGIMALDCGHDPSPHSEHTTGTAQLPDNRVVCYSCADTWQREQMRTSDLTSAYLTDASVTTWTGGLLARVTWRVERTMRVNGRKFRRVYFRAVDTNGRHWHGNSPGDGMYCRMRATRSIPDPVATKPE